jgi:hypothetical protein
MQNLPQNIDALSQDVYTQLLEERNELLTDMKQVKELITLILKKADIMDDDGEMNGEDRIKKTLVKMIPMVLSGKIKSEFSFIEDFYPLLEKYKNL